MESPAKPGRLGISVVGTCDIIHPVHRFKLSDWLKEGHLTWTIFDDVHVWKLIHVCYFLLFPQLSKKLSQLANLELDSLLSRFYGSVRTKISMNEILTALLFGER